MSAKPALMMAAALTTAGLATAVGASPVYTPSSNPALLAEDVSLTGLDLRSERGAKNALLRIREAAKDVCGVPDGSIGVQTRPNACVIGAVNRAVAQLNEPMVTAQHGGAHAAQLAAGER